MLSVVSINDIEKWNRTVKSFRNYDAYYLPGYSKAFQAHGDGDPHLFYYENSHIRGINVAMKRDIAEDVRFTDLIPEGVYFDLSTPYGYGGFLIEGSPAGNCLADLDREYGTYCVNAGIVSEFVRFHPILKNSEAVEPLYAISKLGKTISIELDSKEQIWNDLTSTNRNSVRKAQKSGVDIFWGHNTELYREFVEMYNATMASNNAIDYYYFKEGFYKSIINDFKYNTLIFYAVYQGMTIAMSIIIFANQQMHYHLSASDRRFMHLAPTNLLLYEAACWGCENRYKTFHLGGGLGGREDNLYKFKCSFNRRSDNTFAIGKKIFDEEKYYQLVVLRKKTGGFDINSHNDDPTGFFPKYRADFHELIDANAINKGIIA